MRLSITNAGLRKVLGEEGALRIIKAAGFDCVDYSFSHLSDEEQERVLGDRHLAYARRLRGFLEELELPCNQSHAYYPIDRAIQSFTTDDPEYRKTVRSIQNAAVLGAPVVVLHGDSNCPEGRFFEHNLPFFRSLEPYGEAAGIRIGVENLCRYDENSRCFTGADRLGSPQELAAMVDLLGPRNFTVCVDIGHAGLGGDPAAMLRYLGGRRVGALHVHDNDRRADLHSAPYVGDLDWDEITAALREIGYSGEFALEATTFFNAYGNGELLLDSLKFTVAVARHLMRKVTGGA